MATTVSNSRVGYARKTKKNPDWLFISIFRTIITIIEIGLSFMSFFGASAQFTFGMIAGGIHQSLDHAKGNANVFKTILNFVVPIMAFGFTRVINLKSIDNIVKNASSFDDTIKLLVKAGLKNKDIEYNLLKDGIINNIKEFREFKKIVNIVKKTSYSRNQAADYGARLFQRQATKTFTKQTIRENLVLLNKKVDNLKQFAYQFSDQSKIRKLQKEVLQKIGFMDNDINKFLSFLHSTNKSPQDKMAVALGFLRNAEAKKTVLKQFSMFEDAWKTGKFMMDPQERIRLGKKMVSLSTEAFAPLQTEQAIAKAITTRTKKNLAQKILHAAKRPGSRDFNDYILQPVQAIFDPNDLGRAFPEFVYRFTKKRLKNVKWLKPLVKKTLKAEELFTRLGGILVESQWHLGYRVITKNPVTNWVQITYGKDTGNLRNVYCWATKIQLRNYRNSPGKYYLRTWAYSRGGKKLGLTGLFGASPKELARKGIKTAAGILTFLPNNAMRQIFSLITNPVENIYLMGKGEYTASYLQKFKGSAQRIAVNRTFRVLGKLVIGGAVGRKFGFQMGKHIGRELQRFGTNVLAPLINTAFINIGRRSRGLKPIGSGITTAKIINKTLIGVKSNMRRVLRFEQGNANVVVNAYTVRRKLRILGRLPNTVVPKRPFRGIKFKK